ncbi:MAG: CoA-binding protein [Dehalococcoidia bacterium]|nr:CoA-binding protein [Dehalococcoidia bacterium]
MKARPHEFAAIFRPKSHAVIGASADETKFGGLFLRALLTFGYPGRLYPVNPGETNIFGLKTFARVADIPDPVEFATITTPAPTVPAIVEECLAGGIKAVQILSSGFREAGPEGQRLEEQIAATAARGIRVIGPNCFGVYSPAGGLTILPGAALPRDSGTVALISQSGGYAIRGAERACGWGIRFSQVVSYGNGCDINECDLLEYFCHDPNTKIMLSYIEGPRQGRRFFELLRQACRTKPVILWKGGLTGGGARAVASHTGSLAADETVWDALFRQTGAVMVKSLDEMIDTALAFLHLPHYSGRRLAVIGGGGAIGVAAADACEMGGLSVPQFSLELQSRLEAMLPPAGASTRNPVDMGSPFPLPSAFRSVLETVLSEGEVDLVVVSELSLSVAGPAMARRMGDSGLHSLLAGAVAESAQVPVELRRKWDRPLVMVLPVESVSADDIEAEEGRRKVADYYLSQGIPVFLSLERAVRALANVSGYYERRETLASGE